MSERIRIKAWPCGNDRSSGERLFRVRCYRKPDHYDVVEFLDTGISKEYEIESAMKSARIPTPIRHGLVCALKNENTKSVTIDYA